MEYHSYILKNKNGLIIEFIPKGGRIVSVKMPDGDGYIDICLGYDTAEEAFNGDAFMGAICGRMANRIAKGEFTLGSKQYKLATNEGKHHLHGGDNGFHSKVWDIQTLDHKDYESAYKLSLVSPDGEENYPGNVKVEVIYALNNNNEFLIDMVANTDAPTILNLTSHPYFNLNGVNNGKIFNHELELNSDSYTPINEELIPTGAIQSIVNTDLDFNQPKRLGDVISSEQDAIHAIQGINFNFVLNKGKGDLAFACRLKEPLSGRAVEVFTTQPGLQIYTGMHFNDTEIGKGGMPFHSYCGVAIEAQNFPNAPNHNNFPSCVLMPEDIYHEKTIYKFSF